MVISIIFWSLTLTGIFYPYIRARILNDLIGANNVFLGMALIFFIVISIVLAFGYLYDKLKFWKEQITVAQERNPFSYGSKITPIQYILFYAVLNPNDDEAVVTAQANVLIGRDLPVGLLDEVDRLGLLERFDPPQVTGGALAPAQAAQRHHRQGGP